MIDAANIVQLVGNSGFPIVITIYLLHRFENKIESLENSIQSLGNSVNNHLGKKKGG